MGYFGVCGVSGLICLAPGSGFEMFGVNWIIEEKATIQVFFIVVMVQQ